jgi:phosphoglycerol transferase MdoB-like AlkP superfamily enzyme
VLQVRLLLRALQPCALRRLVFLFLLIIVVIVIIIIGLLLFLLGFRLRFALCLMFCDALCLALLVRCGRGFGFCLLLGGYPLLLRFRLGVVLCVP